jgi:UDP-N-acetyl-2-amino-2-deoxyglucuronate dehydrogenase
MQIYISPTGHREIELAMQMKIACIGFSQYFRRAYLPLISADPRLRFCAICDIAPQSEIARALADSGVTSHPEIFREQRRMYAKTTPDIVIVSTPHSLHYSQALEALRQGCNVLVDKPLALRARDAAELVAIADTAHLRLAVGNNRRYEATYEHVKRLVDANTIGSIKLINYLFASSRWYDYSTTWRGSAKLNGGGVLADVGHIAIDIVTWILNEAPVSVSGISNHRRYEENCALTLRFSRGISATIAVTYNTPRGSVHEDLSLFGSEGSITVRRLQTHRSQDPPHVIVRTLDAETTICPTGAPNPSRPLTDLLDRVGDDLALRCDAKSNMAVVGAIESAYKSIRRDGAPCLVQLG